MQAIINFLPQADSLFRRVWLCIGTLTVIALTFITPPFQVPDEAQHFFRAYQISEGQLIADVESGTAGGYLPSSLPDLVKHFLGTTAIHADRPVRAHPFRVTKKMLSQPLNPEEREFVVFSGAAFYAPVAYAPQALAISIGKLSEASPLTMLYLCRLVNGLYALALLYWAISMFPIGRELVSFAALLPMASFLYASASPDAAMISTAVLFSALVLNRLVQDCWSASDTVVAIFSAITFCTVKPVYAPLLLIGFATALFAKNRVAAVSKHALVLVVTLLVTIVWLKLSSSSVVNLRAGTNIPDQLSHVLREPFTFLMTVRHSLLWNELYYQQLIGVLGWLKVSLPSIAYYLPGLAFLLAWGAEEHKLSKKEHAFVVYNAALLGGCVLLVMIALYLAWTPVGNPTVDGVQGRYFLPLLPLGMFTFLLAFGRKAFWSKTTARFGILILILIEALITIWTISTSYSVL